MPYRHQNSTHDLNRRHSNLRGEALQSQNSGQTFNIAAFLGEDAPQQRDRFAVFSFMDKDRQSSQQENLKWQQEVTNMLLTKESEEEKSIGDSIDRVSAELQMERQVSDQDQSPLID